MTDAMKELYDIFKEDIDQKVLEKSKSKWIKEAYLNKSDKKHKVYGYEDYKIDLNSVVDEDVDIEKIVETKMRIKDLY